MLHNAIGTAVLTGIDSGRYRIARLNRYVVGGSVLTGTAMRSVPQVRPLSDKLYLVELSFSRLRFTMNAIRSDLRC